MAIRIDLEKCNGCGNCVAACSFDAIELADGKPRVKEGCILCGACQDACPCDAIVIETAAEAPVPSGDYRGIWVFAEQHGGVVRGVAYELLSRGRELANALGVELAAVCLGNGVAKPEELAEHGADKVYMMDDPSLAGNDEDLLAGGLVELIRQHKPEIVLAGATALGRSLLPRIAAILGTGLTADCTGLDIDPDKKLLLQTRPTFGGNIMATIICPSQRPQMATVRPRVFRKSAPDSARRGRLIRVDFDRERVTSRTKLISFVEDLGEKVKLEDADIIVAGGRGLEKPENFGLIEELAKVMGAAAGSSRPPVDEGWVPYARQVGQTGKTVCPRLYVACGISGAVQHLAGMQTADCIVAINSDPAAPIFEVATYGIVGDLFKVVPLLIEKLGG